MLKTLKVSPSAKAVLQNCRPASEIKDYVVSITWGRDVDPSTDLGRKILERSISEDEIKAHTMHGIDQFTKEGNWCVGHYLRTQISPERIVTFEHIDFYVEDWYHDQLEGKTLDFVDGQFVVHD